MCFVRIGCDSVDSSCAGFLKRIRYMRFMKIGLGPLRTSHQSGTNSGAEAWKGRASISYVAAADDVFPSTAHFGRNRKPLRITDRRALA